jgi:nucleoside-diphosphate-sugar epimerase
MMRILISGATGFLGLPCVRQAAAAGIEVHAVARADRSEFPAGVQFHAVDLFDDEQVTALAAAIRPTHLLHLAWVATPGVYWTSPDNRRWADASLKLLNTFAEYGGRRAALAGTCAEYDWAGGGLCHEFDTPTRPTTVYGTWKNRLRERVELVAGATGVRVAWARLFFLYGPREHPARLVPGVTNALLAGRPAEITAGTQVRDFLHVEDAADALVRLLLSDVPGPVNIGSGEPVVVRTVVETVAEVVGRPDLVRLGAKPTPANEPPRLYADVGRLRNEVGWSPRMTLRQGLADTVAWWRGCDAA